MPLDIFATDSQEPLHLHPCCTTEHAILVRGWGLIHLPIVLSTALWADRALQNRGIKDTRFSDG
jgi:hypothetical protein